MGLTVFEKMECQNNTDNQIMMNEGNKCLSHSLITLPPHRGREGGDFTGKGKKMRAALNIPPPPAKTYSLPLTLHLLLSNSLYFHRTGETVPCVQCTLWWVAHWMTFLRMAAFTLYSGTTFLSCNIGIYYTGTGTVYPEITLK